MARMLGCTVPSPRVSCASLLGEAVSSRNNEGTSRLGDALATNDIGALDLGGCATRCSSFLTKPRVSRG
jgi:hypothetical protein